MARKQALTADILAEYRKNKARLRAIQDTKLGQLRPVDSEEEKQLKGYIETVDYILEQLPERKATILRMSYIKGYSMVKVSGLLNYNYEYTSLLKVNAAKEFEEIVTHLPDTNNKHANIIYTIIKNIQNEKLDTE